MLELLICIIALLVSIEIVLSGRDNPSGAAAANTGIAAFLSWSLIFTGNIIFYIILLVAVYLLNSISFKISNLTRITNGFIYVIIYSVVYFILAAALIFSLSFITGAL
ncbi:MAG: hypothetical protein R3Y21_00055 [Mycoplasmatota bacterium]